MPEPATITKYKAARARWAGHMRRGQQLKSENDFLQALSLVPELLEPRTHLVKTLRGLADLYAETGKLEDAAMLFDRISAEAERPTKVFWCDFARTLFLLAEERLRNKKEAKASQALEKVREVAAQVPGHAEMALLCRDGYLQIGSLYEQAGAYPASELYFERALGIPPLAQMPDSLTIASELAWRSYWKRNFSRAEHWIEKAARFDPAMLHAKNGAPAARLASLLAALGGTAMQDHLPKWADRFFELGEKYLREAAPQGSVELSDLLVAWSSFAANPVLAESRLQEALNLREALLGENHPRTRELRSALGLYGESGFRQGFGDFKQAPPPPKPRPAFKARAAGPEELKRLHRSLVKLAHPDQASDAGEVRLRNQLMMEINEAFERDDHEALARLSGRIRTLLANRGWLKAGA